MYLPLTTGDMNNRCIFNNMYNRLVYYFLLSFKGSNKLSCSLWCTDMLGWQVIWFQAKEIAKIALAWNQVKEVTLLRYWSKLWPNGKQIGQMVLNPQEAQVVEEEELWIWKRKKMNTEIWKQKGPCKMPRRKKMLMH